jgi:inhibitor of cysteine peptidase
MIALAVLGVALLSGCAKPADNGGAGGKGTGTVVVTKAEADKTVTAAPGQTLVVVLDANPSTGYTWSVASAPEFLKSEGEPAFTSGAKQGEVGAGGKQTLKFTVTAAGMGDLSLSYSRPWESVAPAETFMVQVESK